MEPPTAKEIIKQENSYSINSDKNHSFNITFQNLNSTIGISATYEDDIMKHNYEKKITLDELKQNKYLALCDSIDEIYDELIRLLNKNQYKIIEETNKIYISIPVEHLKVKEILIVVNEIIKNDSEKINELFSIISTMKQEIKELKEKIQNNYEIKDLKEENNNIKEEMKNMKENNIKEIKDLKEELKNVNRINENKEKEIEELKKEINELKPNIIQVINKNKDNINNLLEYNKEKDEKIMISNLDSLIIKDKDVYNIRLKNWICPNTNREEIQSKLLYRLSRDGNNYEIFHKNCDNKRPTLIFKKQNRK